MNRKKKHMLLSHFFKWLMEFQPGTDPDAMTNDVVTRYLDETSNESASTS